MRSLSTLLPLLFTGVAMGSTFCGNGPADIPDDGVASTTWIIPVDLDGIVTEARLHLDVTHPWIGDLEITLRSPREPQSRSSTGPGCRRVDGWAHGAAEETT